tara:strand:+ start:110 stop:274 length:165 start_codon:yes stop_codon:yes gene_type:complete
MKKLFLTISVVIFISACGGGGYGSSDDVDPPYGGGTSGPLGIIPNQVEPVQTTD